MHSGTVFSHNPEAERLNQVVNLTSRGKDGIMHFAFSQVITSRINSSIVHDGQLVPIKIQSDKMDINFSRTWTRSIPQKSCRRCHPDERCSFEHTLDWNLVGHWLRQRRRGLQQRRRQYDRSLCLSTEDETHWVDEQVNRHCTLFIPSLTPQESKYFFRVSESS